MKDRIILGIDPGTIMMGFGIIRIQNNQFSLVLMEKLNLSKCFDNFLKLKTIFKKTLSLIDLYHPNELAIESPFYGKNVQSTLKLGKAQCVSMIAGLYRDIPVSEYSPKKIKISITGNGNASKQQIAGIIKTLLNLKHIPSCLDISDSLAVAFCHFFNSNSSTNITNSNSYLSWKSFIKSNPNRIK